MGYINVRDKVFVPPSGIYRMYYLHLRARRGVCASIGRLRTGRAFDAQGGGVCAAVGQRCLDARHLTTAEDLNTDAESHVTTCVVFPRTWRKAARTPRTEHQRSPRTSPQHVRPI
ncbi:hypothetical protein Taro_015512 [Colocasia esculenta]|uniref:Uncharacterized protein n=1 Tax=Colocasia esculenta TaxID=4460 RepID=A0A843UHK8_COLES|nr:hypothetical protein [Colocasia esculenta]